MARKPAKFKLNKEQQQQLIQAIGNETLGVLE